MWTLRVKSLCLLALSLIIDVIIFHLGAMAPEDITKMLHEKSDNEADDSGESDEEKEIITRSDYDSESEEFINSEDSDSNAKGNENDSSDEYFIGRDTICK